MDRDLAEVLLAAIAVCAEQVARSRPAPRLHRQPPQAHDEAYLHALIAGLEHGPGR